MKNFIIYLKINNSFPIFRSLACKFAKELIKEICSELGIEPPKKEKWICSQGGDLRCSYDFTYNDKIIEFNGDFWHMNPIKYKPDYFNKRIQMNASQKWAFDKQKIELAEKNGYKVLTIWETEHIKNKQATINKCIQFLNND